MAEPLLERTIELYCRTLQDAPPDGVLSRMGLDEEGLAETCRLGWCDGSLPRTIPAGGEIRAGLQRLGILDDGGRERFCGCLCAPLLDPDGQAVGLVGIPAGRTKAVVLSNCRTRLWNAPALAQYGELLLAGSLIDALSLKAAGCHNVLGLLGRGRLPSQDIEAIGAAGIAELSLPGFTPAGTLRRQLRGRRLRVLPLAEGQSPHEVLLSRGPQHLASAIAAAEPAGPPPNDSGQSTAVAAPEGLMVERGARRYELLGIERNRRSLRVTLRIDHAGRLYIETLDLYSARARRALCADLCRLFDTPSAIAEADIGCLLKAAEDWRPAGAGEPAAAQPPMSPAQRREAEDFGRAGDLLDRIVADYESRGLVGERANKLLCYIAAVSRKMDTPLSVLVLSSSGAGKSALQDATLALCPPEDVVKLTTLSGRALFYKGRDSLRHKILAIEEGAGAQSAAYAIRSLISAGELIIESAVRDTASGRLTTMVNRVQGPTAIFLTTTDPDTDPETRSRFFVTSVDESPEQTRRILVYQRSRHTLRGLTAGADAILERHHAFQRLLRPLAVVNPYADRLRFGDDRLQGRRDQPKYLNLIRAIAFLRQMDKPLLRVPAAEQQAGLEYVEVDLEDIRAANGLAHEILGGSLDELSRPARSLLMLLEQMVRQRAQALQEDGLPPAEARSGVRFTRRDVREFTGWANSRVHRNLRELSDMEYVVAEPRRGGEALRYRLAYEGQGKKGERFMLGLVDPDELDENGGEDGQE